MFLSNILDSFYFNFSMFRMNKMKDPDNKNKTHLQKFGPRLKKMRKQKSLTQKAFADIGKVSVQSQRLYETGERSPNSEYLFNISSLGVDISYLVTGLSPKTFEVNKLDFRPHVLAEILEVIETWSSEMKYSFTIQAKAELTSLFYANFGEIGKVNHEFMHGYLKLINNLPLNTHP